MRSLMHHWSLCPELAAAPALPLACSDTGKWQHVLQPLQSRMRVSCILSTSPQPRCLLPRQQLCLPFPRGGHGLGCPRFCFSWLLPSHQAWLGLFTGFGSYKTRQKPETHLSVTTMQKKCGLNNDLPDFMQKCLCTEVTAIGLGCSCCQAQHQCTCAVIK